MTIGAYIDAGHLIHKELGKKFMDLVKNLTQGMVLIRFKYEIMEMVLEL